MVLTETSRLTPPSDPVRPGTAHLSGVQATIRFLVEVLKSDRERGLRTAAFVSGYQGSPLAGFDRELQRVLPTVGVDIVHQPGVNEELGATAVMGSQLASTLASARYDGVLGVWYAKAPGLDRSMDALRHANFAGASRHGGAIALVGDDPAAKSSTLPSASEGALAELGMPVLFPRTLSDVLELGQHAAALSRYSGAWVAMKLVTTIADAEGTVVVGDPIVPVLPAGFEASAVSGDLLTPTTLAREPEVLTLRLDAAARYGDANGLNRVLVEPRRARISLVASGTVVTDLLEALRLLGLDEAALAHLGVRVSEIRMPYPIGPGFAAEVGRDAHDVLVVEERRELVEHQVRALLASHPDRPVVWGRRDREGAPFIPRHGSLDAASLARILHGPLAARLDGDLIAPPRKREMISVTTASRVPWYCPGCPHSVSTTVPEGTLVGAGIGCHSIVRFMPEERVGQSIGITQMGGEGAQWIGMAPFVEDPHIVQNLGDGTFFHSGHLAVRAAIAADVSITFKILWNGVSAMTGGQNVAGGMAVLDLTKLLMLEGAKQVIITTDDTAKYRRARLPAGASVRDRDAVIDVQRELAAVRGVTVMIHDQACATELKRARKRGLAPKPIHRVVINERVCEGCGDCQTKSNCLSLQTVDTAFGPKTRIDEESCNVDLSCLAGDCPAFTLVAGAAPTGEVEVVDPTALPDAVVLRIDRPLSVRIAGVGGTGVVTAAHLLARAAMLDGLEVWGLDQTGLSQKAGAVISDLRIGDGAAERSNVLGPDEVDVLLAADLVAATRPAALEGASPERTAVVGSLASSLSGPMILGLGERRVPVAELEQLLTRSVRAGAATFVDADELARRATGTTAAANVALLGVACQLGLLPVSAGALEAAIDQNGVAVDANRAAFDLGRAWAAGQLPAAAGQPGPAADVTDLVAAYELPKDHEHHIALLGSELIAYQDRRLATRFLDLVARTWRAEQAVGGDGSLAVAVADGAYKLFAYKDEYEVARLLLDHPSASGRTVWLLHPPALRSRGLARKIHVGGWGRPVMRTLRASRRLRGTRLDPFGRGPVRVVERRLAAEYVTTVDTLLGALRPDNLAAATAIAALPGLVRGYEDVKLGSVASYDAAVAAQLADLRASLS
ncbi:MAG: 2-oxoacid ferredoxin oxidoreductase [Acidimicrobiales bacterium]|nr:2-oxoacid ferredoxin oxidoreductase [Acidimicrobiales bacterium]